jgi:protein-S-isoprenylcysteine O-methyltransferase Ste14
LEPSTDALPSRNARTPDLAVRLARIRVPLGFAAGVVALWLATPSWRSLALGFPVAALGEALRIWAAGHLKKGREVTKSGPYRFTGHPLYLGSSLMAAGIAIACASLLVALVGALYLGVTFVAAIRSEEAGLRAKFGPEYDDYRAGRATDDRAFSLARALKNREHRAVIGLALAMFLLALKIGLML